MLPLMAEWSLSKQILSDVCCNALQITLKRRQAASLPVAINMAAWRLLGSLPVTGVLAVLALTIPAGEIPSF